jgi:ectoine hydroxylase-related dioxygenase (phytanoyl-CoA dioxygenase family)
VDDWSKALRIHGQNDFYASDDPTPNDNPVLASLLRNFHSRDFWAGENELVVRPPQFDATWTGPRLPHCDMPVGRHQCDLVNTLIYLTDVESHGGAFMYWPGSHLAAWDFFQRHPLDYLSQGDRPQDDTFAELASTMEGEPVEFLGEAGDLLLWHSLLLHSASINHRETTRLALFGRWGEPKTPGETHFDFAAGPWSSSQWEFADQAGARV